MSAWDSPAPAPVSGPTNFDVLDAAPGPAPVSAPVPAVETVSDDEEPPVAQSVPVPPAPVVDDDPFASAGLLGDMPEPALPSMETSQKFEYNGSTMAPMAITTAQFGQQWVSCTASSPISMTSSKIRTLQEYMEACGKVGAHVVEAITATNEGICAGMVNGGSQIALIHAKLTPGTLGTTINLTVKSSDSALAGTLAMYLQTMLR